MLHQASACPRLPLLFYPLFSPPLTSIFHSVAAGNNAVNHVTQTLQQQRSIAYREEALKQREGRLEYEIGLLNERWRQLHSREDHVERREREFHDNARTFHAGLRLRKAKLEEVSSFARPRFELLLAKFDFCRQAHDETMDEVEHVRQNVKSALEHARDNFNNVIDKDQARRMMEDIGQAVDRIEWALNRFDDEIQHVDEVRDEIADANEEL